ncbi:MAG TPA: CaiB/BaiF CoA-transferase family protein [Nocardioidaceae bacterium]|nr:CaiB/BaiF CoA-transferase family protein [Nocardioidaceae bacterium]
MTDQETSAASSVRGSATGPLAGVRVVELAGIGPTPFAAMTLADMGADVVRIDRPGSGPMFGAAEADLLNRGRRSVAVNLKHPDGVATVLRLVERAEVLVEGFRPGVAERLGLGPDDCRRVNPRLVYGRMTGWGQDGPLAHTAGHDIGYIATTGALYALGRAGGPPQPPVNLLGDFGGGAMYLVTGVLAALLEARASGQGQVVDAAIVDGTAHLSSMVVGMRAAGAWSDERGTNLLDTGAPYYDVYETSDGRHMALGALEPHFYDHFLARFGVDDLPDRHDPQQWPVLRERIARRFAELTQEEWTEIYDGTDACVAPVLTFGEAAKTAHLSARGTYVEHHGVVQPAPAPRFSRTPAALGSPPVAAGGQDSRAALQDWGVEDVDALIESGAVTQA